MSNLSEGSRKTIRYVAIILLVTGFIISIAYTLLLAFSVLSAIQDHMIIIGIVVCFAGSGFILSRIAEIEENKN